MQRNIKLISTVLFLISSSAFAQQRKVLVEQFTNSGCPPCAGNTPVVASYVNANPNTVLMLAYHTSFPYFDSMYFENPAQSNVRAGFYNIVAVPYSKVDGNYFSGNLVPSINSTIQNRATIAPRYNINFTTSYVNNFQVSASVMFESVDVANQNEPLIAQIVVVEKNVLKSSYVCCAGANTENEYPWVVRRMLPDENGTALINKFSGGMDMANVNWNANNIKDFSELRIIAFVQNLLTKEVYQSEISTPVTTTGIMSAPNSMTEWFSVTALDNKPAVAVYFNKPVSGYRLKVINLVGKTVHALILNNNEDLIIDTQKLNNGLYFISVESEYERHVKKIVIQ